MNRISHSQLFAVLIGIRMFSIICSAHPSDARTNGRGSDFNTSSACSSFTYAGSLQTKEFFTEKRNAFR